MARFVPFIVDAGDNQKIGVKITRMKKTDAAQTEKEPHWQTSWMSEYIQSNSFEKYALKTADGELVALAAYEILENDVMVHITYIESQPQSNPTIVGQARKYHGIGRVLIAYGIKLSIDHACGGTGLPLKQRFRSWQSTMCRIMVQVLFQVLAELRAMSFPVKLQ